jgi:MFS family permease
LLPKAVQDAPVFASLHYRDFRRLFLSTSTSGLAQWTLIVGRGWLAFHLTGSSTWVGVVTFAGFLPFMLGPIGGVLADRFERRRIVALSAAAGLLFSLLLAALTLADAIAAWHLAAITLMMSLPRAAELPARQAIISNTVPPGSLVNAFSLSSVATFGTRAGGPALVIPLIDTVGAGGIFAIAAGFYLISVASALAIEVSSVPSQSEVLAPIESLAEGVKYMLVTPSLAVIMLVVVFHCALTMSFDSLLPAFAVQRLEGSGASFSAMATSVGVGALVGSVVVSGLVGERAKGRALFLAAFLSGITPAFMALPMELMSPAVAVAIMGAMGASQFAFMTLTGALVQAASPDRLRGRVASLYLLSAGGLMAWVNLLNGALADVWHVPLLFLVPALLYLTLLSFISVTRERLRELFRAGTLAAPATAAVPAP